MNLNWMSQRPPEAGSGPRTEHSSFLKNNHTGPDTELKGYTNINELGDQRRFYFPDAPLWVKSHDFDSDHSYEYLPLLENCYFKGTDIAKIGISRRYITGAALIDRWREYRTSESQAKAFVKGRIKESRLLIFHPIYAGADLEESVPEENRDFQLPPIDQCLFCWDEVMEVEAAEFGETIQANANTLEPKDRSSGSVANEPEACPQSSPEKNQGEAIKAAEKPLVYISKKATLERLSGIVKITPKQLENMLRNANHNHRIKACMPPSGRGWCLALLIKYFADKGGILKDEFVGKFGEVDMDRALREAEKS
jgi:hypothetical protein